MGRPPGSKAKTKLDTKWATQGIRRNSPSPCNSPPPPLTPITPDTSSTDSSSLTDRPMPVLFPGLSENISKPLKPILSNTPQNSDKSKKLGQQNSSPTKAAAAIGWYFISYPSYIITICSNDRVLMFLF